MTSLVRDVMTTDVVTVEPWTPFRDIVTQLAEHRISAVPVLDPRATCSGLSPRPGSPTGTRSPSGAPAGGPGRTAPCRAGTPPPPPPAPGRPAAGRPGRRSGRTLAPGREMASDQQPVPHPSGAPTRLSDTPAQAYRRLPLAPSPALICSQHSSGTRAASVLADAGGCSGSVQRTASTYGGLRVSSQARNVGLAP
jgi:CBS domain-containing protein